MTTPDDEISELEAKLASLKAAKAAEAQGAGAPLSPDRDPKGSGAALWIACGIGFVLLVGGIVSYSNANRTPISGAPITPTAPVIAEPEVPRVAWVYSSTADPMTDKKTETACVKSSNTVRLGWPYSDVPAEICIRQSPKWGRDVYIQLRGDGQIVCDYHNCNIKARFGDGAQQAFTVNSAADGSSNVKFVSNTARFITGLQAADVTRVEIQLYQNGSQIMEFNTKGLEWPRPTA